MKYYLSLVLLGCFCFVKLGVCDTVLPSMGEKKALSPGWDDSSDKLFRTQGDSPKEGEGDAGTIFGDCVVPSELGGAMTQFCPPTEVILYEGKKEVSRMILNDGRFSFKVSKGKSYYLALNSKTLELQTPRVGPFEKGRVYLVAKVKKKS